MFEIYFSLKNLGELDLPTGFNSDDFFEAREQIKDSKSGCLSVVSLSELFREPPEQHHWLVNQLVLTSGLTLISGRPKSLKSHFVRQLLYSVAKGITFLGKETVQSPVIYIAAEEKRNEVRRHFELMGATGDEPIYLHTGIVRHPSVAELRVIAEKVNAKFIVIDTLLRFVHFADVCDYGLVTRELEPLIALARSGVAILRVHHSAKASFADVYDSPLGSTALTGSCDGMIGLIRRKDSVSMSSRQRYAPDFPETYLDFNSDSRTLSLGVMKEEVDEDRVTEHILLLLSSAENALSEPEIEKRISGSTEIKRRVLRSLLAKGSVRRRGKGAKGSPFLYSLKISPDLQFP